MLNRRTFVVAGGAAVLSACTQPSLDRPMRSTKTPIVPAYPPLPEFYQAISDEPFPVEAVPEGTIAPNLWRQETRNLWPNQPRGTIVVDPDAAMLCFLNSAERATRYGVSVGAAGFAWKGTARLQFCRKWPRWNVPEETILRKPELEPYSVSNGGMDPGPENPMGARALYLFQNGEDTLYRVHGDALPHELGKAVSSGCIRMLNQDVIHLHKHAVHGASVIVLPSMRPSGIGHLY